MKLISIIGYSGSGKTHFITNVIKRLKSEMDLTIIVIKNVHVHEIDTEGKDSFEFSNAGADFSIIRNKYHDNAVFFKKEISFEELLDWILNLSKNINLVFIEGFRDLKVPSVLCAENIKDVEAQLNPNVKIISGLVSTKLERKSKVQDLPIINIQNEFHRFLEIFGIK